MENLKVIWEEKVGVLEDGTQAAMSGAIDTRNGKFSPVLCGNFVLNDDNFLSEVLVQTNLVLPFADIKRKDGEEFTSFEDAEEACIMAHQLQQHINAEHPTEFTNNSMEMLEKLYHTFTLYILSRMVSDMNKKSKLDD